MSDEKKTEELVITATILPENREVYEHLIAVSERKGMSREEVNTKLVNAGLFFWVERIREELEAKESELENTEKKNESETESEK